MYRFRGVSEAIREPVGPVLTDAFALVTRLGGMEFLLVGLSLLYWLGDRESTATVIGYTLVALVVTLLLKNLFGLPRPPAAARAIAEQPETSGFPSGHAISSSAVYGGLVVAHDRVRDARFAVPALVVILLVGLSRVVIGVHYVGDVLAGYGVGAVVVGSLWLTVRHRSDLACLVAGVLAVPTFFGTDAGAYALFGVGASVGAAVTLWHFDVGSFPVATGASQQTLLAVSGLSLVGILFAIAEASPFGLLAVLANAGLLAGVFLWPRILETGPVASLAS